MTTTLIRPEAYRPSRWKNGQGASFDIAGDPAGAGWSGVVWRVSIAEIEADCDFSDFSGIDRTFTAIAGRGLTLEPAGQAPMVVEALHRPVSFPGEWRIRCRLHDGPARAFNVLTARGRASHQVRIAKARTAIAPTDVTLIHALVGVVRLNGETAPEGATLRADGTAPATLEVDIECLAAIVQIQIQRETSA